MLSCFSHVWFFATLWTIAHEVPLSMGFSRQEYWSGCHALLQGIFPIGGLNLHPLHWQVGSLPLAQLGKPLVNTSQLQNPDQEDYIPTPGTEDAFPGEFPLPGKEDLTPVRWQAGVKFPTDANQLMELCHPGGSTLRTGLCELNRNSEHEFYQNVSQFSLLREWELCTGNVCVVCVCRGVYAYVCLWWECVYVWWGCMRVCVCTCLMRVCGWWGCVCVCVVRICVCCKGVCVWWWGQEMRWKGATSSFS